MGRRDRERRLGLNCGMQVKMKLATSNTRRKVGVVVLSTAALAIGFGVWQLGTMTSRACREPSYSDQVNTAGDGEYFPSNYRVARQRFLDAARAAGGWIESIQNPHRGPDDGPLFMDVVSLGSEDAAATLVVSSGTHGVEGFAGSGIQTRLLRDGIASRLPSDLNLLMIHGINPYGMAHLRRFTEDNVDLNRNFRDHSLPHPDNAAYVALADALGPTSISFWSEVASWSRLLWFRLTAGKAEAQAALSKGQYSHPQGLFYGGTFDTWSNVTIRSVVPRYLAGANRVVIVDIHTGLGEYRNAEIILNSPDHSPEYQRALAIWGPELTRTTVTGESVSPHLKASLKLALPRLLPAAEVTAVSLEFGTLPVLEVLKALRAENWLHHHGGSDHPRAKELKTCLLRAFHPGTQDWEAAVWEQGKHVIERVPWRA